MLLSLVAQKFYDLAKADAGVKAALGDPPRLYEYVNQNQGGKVDWSSVFATYQLSSAPFDAKDFNGEEMTLQIDVFSRIGSWSELESVAFAFYAMLHRKQVLITQGVGLGYALFISYTPYREADGITMHGTIRFRVTVTAA